jgi:hypothetical protein
VAQLPGVAKILRGKKDQVAWFCLLCQHENKPLDVCVKFYPKNDTSNMHKHIYKSSKVHRERAEMLDEEAKKKEVSNE